MQITKKCFKCEQIKIITDFYPHKQMGDGYLNKCKECAKLDEKLRRIQNPERVKQLEQKRSKKPERIAYAKKHNQEWRQKNKLAYQAHCKVNNALRNGKLIKPELCEICGLPSKLHGHHVDYSKPLEVIWLCAKCHGQIQ
jgi:ribosome-binding protein aMBF1 (putative translation factor)